MRRLGIAFAFVLQPLVFGCATEPQRTAPARETRAPAAHSGPSHEAREGSTTGRTKVAIVDGEPIWAERPSGLSPERYRAWLDGLIYRSAVRSHARKHGIDLSTSERAQEEAAAPSAEATADYRRSRNMSYETFLVERLETALIRKVEKIELAKRRGEQRSGFEDQVSVFRAFREELLSGTRVEVIDASST